MTLIINPWQRMINLHIKQTYSKETYIENQSSRSRWYITAVCPSTSSTRLPYWKEQSHLHFHIKLKPRQIIRKYKHQAQISRYYISKKPKSHEASTKKNLNKIVKLSQIRRLEHIGIDSSVYLDLCLKLICPFHIPIFNFINLTSY